MNLDVNEVFETVQGEARWTGTPAVFVRLQGCDVGCPWCDTKYTWKKENQVPFSQMIDKKDASDSYASVDACLLADWICETFRATHIVITGGEPCDYDLTDLTNALCHKGRTTQIETSGTRVVLASPATWVTVSPKIGMPGGYKIMPEALNRADEIKMPIGKPADILRLKDVLLERPKMRLVWLQPLSQSKKATKLCIEEATKNGWRISCQTHKYLGVR